MNDSLALEIDQYSTLLEHSSAEGTYEGSCITAKATFPVDRAADRRDLYVDSRGRNNAGEVVLIVDRCKEWKLWDIGLTQGTPSSEVTSKYVLIITASLDAAASQV